MVLLDSSYLQVTAKRTNIPGMKQFRARRPNPYMSRGPYMPPYYSPYGYGYMPSQMTFIHFILNFFFCSISLSQVCFSCFCKCLDSIPVSAGSSRDSECRCDTVPITEIALSRACRWWDAIKDWRNVNALVWYVSSRT